ncbi:DUF192 domain-containing protein [Sphingobium phenoxybenzoativorans]|uniref:DUF192 domain-containing protein n=1 Tax=Sphingobium phenoxybenzoativorans TaxID=1592790 RepID=UPI00087290ED|nr:DUF192 domain-containing protein [Sphingobium phenoxybenzoativorans]
MRLSFLAPLILLAACSATADKQDNANSAAATATSTARPATIPLIITANGKAHRFDVEIALTKEEQAKGLMFRKSLSPDGGMVFPMSPPRTASFWMENTFIPLDMIFVRTDGTIALLAANTKPYSREPVSAGVPVAGIVELAGGRAAELGIDDKATVQWGNCAAPARPDEAWDSLNFCPANGR